MDEDKGHITYKHQVSEVCEVLVVYQNEKARNTVLSSDPNTFSNDNGLVDGNGESLIFKKLGGQNSETFELTAISGIEI